MYGVSLDLGLRHPRLLSAYARARRLLHEEESGSTSSKASSFRERQAALVAGFLDMDAISASRALDSVVYATVERRFSRVTPFRGAVECLETLRDRGLVMGLLSDLPPTAKLEHLGLSSFFSCAICSEDSGALKPNPKPFLDLAACMGADPHDMVYVGNKYWLDCVGAKAAGMKTALYSRKRGPHADYSFLNWKDLSSWILKMARA